MTALPSGIVALLMTDVEGSTALWSESRQDMDAAVRALDHDVRAFVDSHRGNVVKTRGEGDRHFAAFDRASDAISAAAAVQRATADWPCARR